MSCSETQETFVCAQFLRIIYLSFLSVFIDELIVNTLLNNLEHDSDYIFVIEILYSDFRETWNDVAMDNFFAHSLWMQQIKPNTRELSAKRK